MHWVCSALKASPVMWVTPYNNSYMDGAVVSMTWAHPHHLQGTSHPQTRAVPTEATQDGVAGSSRRGHKGTSNPLSQPSLQQPLLNREICDPFSQSGMGCCISWWALTAPAPPPTWGAQRMDGLNSSSMNREHGWETFKPSSRWAFRPSHARWARATLMSMTRTITGLGWLLPWTLTNWG